MYKIRFTKTFKQDIKKFKSSYYNIAPVIGLISLSPDRVKKSILSDPRFGKIFVTNIRGGITILWQKHRNDIILRNILKN